MACVPVQWCEGGTVGGGKIVGPEERKVVIKCLDIDQGA